jgi:hypothetical protein
MSIINDPRRTGTRYYMNGTEKRNVSGWARYMDRAERVAYRNPREFVFREQSETLADGTRVTRFIVGRRGETEREGFRIERTAEAYRDYLEGVGVLKIAS